MAKKGKGKVRAKAKQTGKKTGRGGANRPFPWIKHYPPGLSWDMELEPRVLSTMLDDSVSRYADLPCTYFLGQRLTYAEIGALVDRAARGLQNMGIGKGTRVGLLLPNSPTYVVFFFAVLKTGATVVNFNPLYTVEELDFQVRDSGTEIMVTLDLAVLFTKVEALLERGGLEKGVICSFSALLPRLKGHLFRFFKGREISDPAGSAVAPALVLEADLLDNAGAPDDVPIAPESDIAVLQYTGGTTGTPKGAMLTHANLSINIQQVMSWTTNVQEGSERIMGILPFFHVFAMTSILNLGIATGSELILMPKFELVDALKLIHATRPTILPGVPTLYNAMLHHAGIEKFDLSSLKFCISGGAALPIEVKRGFEAISPCKLVEGYGLSETSPVATCNPVDGPVREGSIGIPVPGTILSIRSLDDPEKELPTGEDGEICIAGPQVMKGYWNKPDESCNAFTGDFFRSGDIGHMDEDGFTYIVDRLKDMIIASGYNIYPRRIEEAIYEFPAVEEVTVIGIPDEYRGEVPKAFVKLRDGHSATADDIFEFLKPKISKLEMPSEIEFRDGLPKTMIGKLSKKELRAEEEGARKS
jgi:long-chain acyl-CoA synthetase